VRGVGRVSQPSLDRLHGARRMNLNPYVIALSFHTLAQNRSQSSSSLLIHPSAVRQQPSGILIQNESQQPAARTAAAEQGACMPQRHLPAQSWPRWADRPAHLTPCAISHTPRHPGSGQCAGALRRCKWSGAASARTAAAAASRPKTLLTAL
jgi:hypothetical protein